MEVFTWDPCLRSFKLRFAFAIVLGISMFVVPSGELIAVHPNTAITDRGVNGHTSVGLPSTSTEVCSTASLFEPGPFVAQAALDESGPLSCIACLGCVAAAGYCVITGGWACVAGIPAHLWTGILAGCVEACEDCLTEEEM